MVLAAVARDAVQSYYLRLLIHFDVYTYPYIRMLIHSQVYTRAYTHTRIHICVYKYAYTTGRGVTLHHFTFPLPITPFPPLRWYKYVCSILDIYINEGVHMTHLSDILAERIVTFSPTSASEVQSFRQDRASRTKTEDDKATEPVTIKRSRLKKTLTPIALKDANKRTKDLEQISPVV